jgi:acetoacetyl-CoA synthetase
LFDDRADPLWHRKASISQPAQRVEDIAAGYIEQMRTVQACGPYAIAGYSFGGLVGLEIAQQLSRAAEQIELLCLLDTYAQQDLPWYAWLRHRYSHAKNTLSSLPLSQIPGYLAGRLAIKIDRGPTRIGQVLRRRVAGSETAQLPRTPQLMHEKMRSAMMTYRPQPYHAGPIIYVRAAIPLVDYFDPMPLWRRIARSGLTVIDIPDGHLDLLGSNAKLVAAALDHALAAADVALLKETESSSRKPIPA